jgi:DNA gyrase inhibitor GyrI
MMENTAIRIVRLEPFRAASFYGFGSSPEEQAFGKLQAWAGPHGYLDDLENHRIFGFNNPNPSAGSPNYGYEFWMVVGPEVEPQGEMRILSFEGGLYAVLRLPAPFQDDPYLSIPNGWQQLTTWLEASDYHMGTHQWLEEQIQYEETPPGQWSMDLYLPIAE